MEIDRWQTQLCSTTINALAWILLKKKERIRIGRYAVIVQLKDELSSKMGIDRLPIAQQLRQTAIGSESSSRHPECADQDGTQSFIGVTGKLRGGLELLYRLGYDETAHACVGSGLSDDTRAAQNGTQKREAEFCAGTEQYRPGLLARRARTAKHSSAKYEQAGGGWEDSDRNDWCERGDSNPHGFTRQILSSQ